MYETHFGLQRRPFPASPSCDTYYPASGHEQAFAQLLQAAQDDEGLLVLTGPPGTGKTLLGQRLLEQSWADSPRAFLTHGRFAGTAGLLQAILYDFGLPHEGLTEQELRLRLTEHLLQHYAEGRGALVVLDEAQHLSPALLEELRLFGNLEGRAGKALHVVLLGQESLTATLQLPELTAFVQRIGVMATLPPLDVHEAADYLVHHVRQAGGQPGAVMSDEAVEILARGSRGVPRLLNRVAHQALRLAFQAGATQVDAEAALECLAQNGLAEEPQVEAPSVTDEAARSAAVLPLDAPAKADNGGPGHEPVEDGRGRRLFAAPKRPA
jgi:type II secretory pathway predicted ATPase ExeA